MGKVNPPLFRGVPFPLCAGGVFNAKRGKRLRLPFRHPGIKFPPPPGIVLPRADIPCHLLPPACRTSPSTAARVACGSVRHARISSCSAGSRVSAFAFSASLVQAAVQAPEGIAVTSFSVDVSEASQFAWGARGRRFKSCRPD
jgi:hypothetical protein